MYPVNVMLSVAEACHNNERTGYLVADTTKHSLEERRHKTIKDQNIMRIAK